MGKIILTADEAKKALCDAVDFVLCGENHLDTKTPLFKIAFEAHTDSYEKMYITLKIRQTDVNVTSGRYFCADWSETFYPREEVTK